MAVSVCTPVHRDHPAPNVATLVASLPPGVEVVVALNGVRLPVPAGARTVALPANLGVGPGWNAAARAATGDVLVFANDDVVLGDGAVDRLVAVLRERPDAGVVGPAGALWDRARWEHREHVRPAAGEILECDAVSGFLFAVRRADWEAAGGFDEAYAPASWEEIDFNLALQQRGLRSLAVGGVAHEHDWGISRRQPPWRTVRWNGRRELLWSIHRRNRRHFLSKWA